jgi:hypothetical protein
MNNSKTITASEIFAKNQILTLEVAMSLVGKTIAVTNYEYEYNTPEVRIGLVTSIESQWDLAGKEDHLEASNGKWATRQDYWKSYMSDDSIQDMKNRMKVVSETPLYATYSQMFGWFFGSDEDRPIFFVEL